MLCDRLRLPVRRCTRDTLPGTWLYGYFIFKQLIKNVLFQVYNIIPSISAITGVSPQRYFWRFSIALHIGPRIPIAFVYKNYYRAQLSRLAPSLMPKTSWLITLILVLNCIEIAALGGVTYISNRENYRKQSNRRHLIAIDHTYIYYWLLQLFMRESSLRLWCAPSVICWLP